MGSHDTWSFAESVPLARRLINDRSPLGPKPRRYWRQHWQPVLES